MLHSSTLLRVLPLLIASYTIISSGLVAADSLTARVRKTMRTAAEYYRTQVANHGGYVYHYSTDLQQRWGEGAATLDQIWVQPPGTPTVGLAYLQAYRATGDRYYLDAAVDAARAVAFGQLKSGGWTNCVDFNPRGERSAEYRNGQGRGKNNSSLDDGQTQSALLLLIETDQALEFQDHSIHDAAVTGLTALLSAQFPNGAFPQVWTGPVEKQPVRAARYPDYEWRTEGRIKNYWDMYTLNDDVCGYVTRTLLAAHRVYDDDRYLEAVKKLGEFLVLAQMPDPQPGWAQQYNYDMQPIWARRFEPPGVSGDESQEAIETLLDIYEATGDRQLLKPIPRALAYLKRSRLRDGRLARYYELQTNRPLYMQRSGRQYSLTYSDRNLPSHYGWKTDARIGELERRYQDLQTGTAAARATAGPDSREIEQIIKALDDRGRWLSVYQGERLVGQPKFALNAKYLSSQVFSNHLTRLAQFVAAAESSD